MNVLIIRIIFFVKEVIKMKKLFNKFLAGAITLALVATLAIGTSVAKNAKADGAVSIGKWNFIQGGQYNPSEEGNEAYINKVTMNGTSEEITGWKTGSGSMNQEQSATQGSTGFTMKIDNNGWDRQWDQDPWRINPWSIRAEVKSPMQAAHAYKVTFKARASKKKYAYIGFNTVVDGQEMAPYDQAPMRDGSDKQVIVLGTTDKTFTYMFDNYVGGTELTTSIMMGCFGPAKDGKAYDYAGNDISDIVTEEEAKWNGTVYYSDFTVEDLGVNPDVPTDPPAPSTQVTTQAPTVAPQPTQAPTVKPSPAPAKTLAKVTKVKVKSVKKKTIKVTWEKVANAKSYQIKVGNKTYKATKNSKKIKNKKFKKGKKVKVKVRAMAAGYKTGAWSKTVKKKLTK